MGTIRSRRAAAHVGERVAVGGGRAASRSALRVRRAALLVAAVVAVNVAWAAGPAVARWRLVRADTSSIAYNQGIAFDHQRNAFFFDGVSSKSNSGLYRTDSLLRQTAANTAVIPRTREGYNHTGDLSFDPLTRRVLLPLECYYPNGGGNTCGVGAIGVADATTLRFRYYVNLARREIKKAMWDEIDPDGRWIWTSSGGHLLAYRAADVTETTARRQRAGMSAGIAGIDLGSVLPTSAVTGASFYRDPRSRNRWLLLSLDLGARFRIISFGITTGREGLPQLSSSHPTTIITIGRSSLNDEPEGLTTTARASGDDLLGGLLRWQMLPTITPSTVFTRILTYQP